MLPVGWLVVAVLAAVLLTMWVTFTLTRLDRLHARVDAAQAALDAQLVRRAAALLSAAEAPDAELGPDQRAALETVAHTALSQRADDQADAGRQAAENGVGRAIRDLLSDDGPAQQPAHDELRETAARVLIARRFYNDAVRDTRTLRARRMPRLLHLAGRRALPQFFDIDDTAPAAPPTIAADLLSLDEAKDAS
jgi:hypothetical protein